MNLETTTLFQPLSLLEFLVVGAEEYRHIPDGSLQEVVDAHTKASTHIGHLTIVVDAGEQTEAVDNQHLGISQISLILILFCLSIAEDFATCQELFNLCEMVLANDVRSNDQST